MVTNAFYVWKKKQKKMLELSQPESDFFNSNSFFISFFPRLYNILCWAVTTTVPRDDISIADVNSIKLMRYDLNWFARPVPSYVNFYTEILTNIISLHRFPFETEKKKYDPSAYAANVMSIKQGLWPFFMYVYVCVCVCLGFFLTVTRGKKGKHTILRHNNGQWREFPLSKWMCAPNNRPYLKSLKERN